MVDPKMLELSIYDGIPHLLSPVVTDPRKAIVAIKWAVREMENRYRAMSKLGVRNIEGYNQRIAQAQREHAGCKRVLHRLPHREVGRDEVPGPISCLELGRRRPSDLHLHRSGGPGCPQPTGDLAAVAGQLREVALREMSRLAPRR